MEVTMSTGYSVTAWRDGKWWTFEIPALSAPSPRGEDHRIVAMGQARTAAEIRESARDVAVMWTDDQDATVRDITFRLPQAVQEDMAGAQKREEEGRTALEDAAVLRRRAVHALRQEGLSQADTAAVLGISRQRVQQLAH
jgi:DNA-directed RNA polymerase specialized sigma24 family protein